MDRNKAWFQLAWGIALAAAGVGIFIAMPYKIAQLKQYSHFSLFFVRLSFYLIAVLLIGGGVKKIYDSSQNLRPEDKDSNP